MPTVIELATSLTTEAARMLANNIKAMPEDKQTWQPLDAGRSALNQAQECAAVNAMTVKVLQARDIAAFDREAFHGLMQRYDTLEKALAALQANTDALVTAIQSFPLEHLDDPVTLPWGVTMTFAGLLLLPFRNMTYHVGQVAYIQTLYGDKETH